MVPAPKGCRLQMKTVSTAVILLALAIASATGAIANDLVREMAKCAALEDVAKRIACYDDLAKTVGVDEPRTTSEKGPGDWTVTRSVSPVDDSETVTSYVRADKDISGWLHTYRPHIIVRCQEHKLDVFITTGMSAMVESGDYRSATIRFDKDPAIDVKMSESTDGEALFFSYKDKDSVLRGFEDHSSVLFRFVPFNSNPTYTTFSLRGSAKAIGEVRRACNSGAD